jgi:hypothetical protein
MDEADFCAGHDSKWPTTAMMIHWIILLEQHKYYWMESNCIKWNSSPELRIPA